MELVDTHCHLHEAVRRTTPVYDKWNDKKSANPEKMIKSAHKDSVNKLVCVGTTLDDSKLAIEFAGSHKNVWSSIGIHPHEAKNHISSKAKHEFANLVGAKKVVAVGECGLDYFYNHSPREAQIEILKFQIELALKHDLPLIFHVREAFDDFWPVFESYKNVRGVLHSFTDSVENMEKAVGHGLFIGVNGIATFSNNPELYKSIPLDNLLLETDAPFLTPAPHRGKINEPKYVKVTAEYLAGLRSEPLGELAAATTKNAIKLFGI